MDYEQTRQRISFDAARLLQARRVTSYNAARWTAARTLTRSYLPSECLPTDMEIRMQLQQLMGSSTAFPEEPSLTGPRFAGPRFAGLSFIAPPDADVPDDVLPDSRFDHYLALLLPLDRVHQSKDTHPEGDVLYHSLQVFEIAWEAQPWDEELLTAALMHDVGKGIDPRDPMDACLRALAGFITDRTRWLIETLPSAHRIREGTLGARARKRLAASEDWSELDILAESDREGRVPGRKVRSAEEAVACLRSLSGE